MELALGRRVLFVSGIRRHRRLRALLAIKYPGDPSLRIMLVVVPWLAVGVGVAGLLLGGEQLWPALFIGSWAVWGVIVGDQLVSVTVGAAAEVGSIVLIVLPAVALGISIMAF